MPTLIVMAYLRYLYIDFIVSKPNRSADTYFALEHDMLMLVVCSKEYVMLPIIL